MSSPPTHNILLDPLPELRAALDSHAFGMQSYTLLAAESFPHTEAERARVAQAHRDGDEAALAGVRAAVDIVLLKDEGTIETTTSTCSIPHTTFESLDALLIAVSPAYVAAMQDELHKRFAGGLEPRRWVDDDDDAEEPAWID